MEMSKGEVLTPLHEAFNTADIGTLNSVFATDLADNTSPAAAIQRCQALPDACHCEVDEDRVFIGSRPAWVAELARLRKDSSA